MFYCLLTYFHPVGVQVEWKASLPAGSGPFHLSVFIPQEDLTLIALGPTCVAVIFPCAHDP